ncbi:MAG: hemerythrin domain-containing protein [Usitatibacter sp.]
MNLIDLPAGFDDPVDSLLGFHRRVERQLAALGRLPGHIEAFGIGAEAMSIASAALSCFGPALGVHHDEEERDLLPLIERRIAASELLAFRDVRRRIEVDHREMERTWRELRRPLEAIGEGILRRLPAGDIQYFRAIASTHISIEEGTLHALALRHLRPEDREVLGRRMQARRAVMKSSSR